MATAYPVDMSGPGASQVLNDPRNPANPGEAGGPVRPMAPMAPMAPMQPGVGAGMQERGRGQQEMPPPVLTAEQQNQLSQMTPEQQTQFLTLLAGDYSGRGAAASEDMSRADALRHWKAPGMRQAGGMTIAANPLEHIAKYMQAKGAQGDYDTAKTGRESAMSDAEDLRGRAMKGLVSRSDALRSQV